MNLNVSGKNIQVTEGLRSYLTKRLEHVTDHFPNLIDVHVVMEVEKIYHKVEMTVKAEGKTFHSEFKTEDMYAAIDGLVDRIERQIRRYKERLKEFPAQKISLALQEKFSDKADFVFTKVREIIPKPMSDEEAILQLEASEYRFHIYKRSPQMSEEDFKKIAENGVEYQKTVMVKQDDNYVLIRKQKGKWDEEIAELKGNSISLLKNSNKILVEEKNIEEAVKHMIEDGRNYYVFYGEETKNLCIVYLRKNKTLGLIMCNMNN